MIARVLMVALLAAGACTGEEAVPSGEGTNATTQDLLSSAPASKNTAPPPSIAAPSQQIDLDTLGFDRGSADSPVRVVEMSDYGCGYCRQFHQETFPVLRREFIDAGKVEWKFLAFDNGMFKNSPHALRAGECMLEQGPALFEAMNERIWDGQPEWKGSSDAAPILSGWAEEVGADMAQYASCVNEDSRRERIDAATALARQVGVRGTPTFFVIGYPPLQGALPTEQFQQVLNMVYADATKGGDR
jgi:protein-disulfide isomerase